MRAYPTPRYSLFMYGWVLFKSIYYFPPLMTTRQNGLVFVFDCWSRKWMASSDAARLKLGPQIVSRNIATHFLGDQVCAIAWKGMINLWAGSSWVLFCKLTSSPSNQARIIPAQGSKCQCLCTIWELGAESEQCFPSKWNSQKRWLDWENGNPPWRNWREARLGQKSLFSALCMVKSL